MPWARVRELLRLAFPVILSRSGMFLMGLVNTALLGRYATEQLAYLSIAQAVTIPLFIGQSGFILGALVLTARAAGAGELAQCGKVWRRGTVYSIGISLIGVVIALVCGELALRALGESQVLTQEGGRVLRINALSLPFMGIYMTGAYFLEGLKRPVPPMIIMAFANVVNLVLNWAFIYGAFGLPALGAEGSAWATTLMRGLLALVIVIYIWMLPDHAALGVRKRAGGSWRDWAPQRRVGYSAGASQAVESTAFSLLTLLAGLLGTVPLAAYSISFQVLGTCFMVAMGFGSATAVLVGHAWGRKDSAEVARAGWLGLRVDWIVVCTLAALLALFRTDIARLFAADPSLIVAAAPLLGWVAFVIVPDHTQAVMAHALRARGDNWVPVATHFISYFLILAPLSWYLALHTANGTEGIVQATLIASLASASFLMARFRYLSRRPLIS